MLLFKFLKPYKWTAFIGATLKLLEAVLEILLPTFVVTIIDLGVNKNDISVIWKMGGIMLATTTISVIFAFVCQLYASKAAYAVGRDIRDSLFQKISSFSHSELDKFGTPTLITRTSYDVNQIQIAINMAIRILTRSIFLCFGGTVMAITLDLKLSIVLIILIPILSFVIYFVAKRSVPVFKIIQKKTDNFSMIIRQNLSGVRVIRAFSKINHEKKVFDNTNNELTKANIKAGKIIALSSPITTFIMNLGMIAVIWFGGIRVNNGNMTQGEVIAFISYIIQIMNSVMMGAMIISLFTKAFTSSTRINEVLKTQSSVIDGKNNLKPYSTAPIVEFKNVSMKYNGSSQNILIDINFSLYKNQTMCIIGGTGSGKTTLINLIPRFYDVSDGTVFFKGNNVKEYIVKNLRKQIAIVPQKTVLFKGSVNGNIRFGKKDATQNEIKLAAKIAQADEFISNLPEGYDSYISQDGVSLSGGQKQRIAIARAIVRKAELLILDDSSSALDYLTDARLQKALKQNLKDIAVIIVTQRIKTAQNADIILCLENGTVAGIGSEKHLLENCEVYRDLYNSQN